MKKILIIFICLIFLVSAIPFVTFAKEYESLIDNADFILSEDEQYLQSRIDFIKENHNYYITLVSGFFESGEEFTNYCENFSEYDSNASGTILIFGESAESYYYYSFPYGEYSDLLNDAIFADFEEFDANAKTYEESYEMYVTLTQIFLETKDDALNVVDEDISQETSSKDVNTPDFESQEISGFDAIIDEADLFTDEEEAELFAEIYEIYQTYDFDITFMTMNEVPSEYEDLLDYLDWYEGLDPTRDGLVFGVSLEKDNREYSTSTRNFGMDVFGYGEVSWSKEALPPLLIDGNYFDAFKMHLEYTKDRIPLAIEETEKKKELQKEFLADYEKINGIGGTIDGIDPVIDIGDILTNAQEETLFARIEEIRNTYDFDVTFLSLKQFPHGIDGTVFVDEYEYLDKTRDGVVFCMVPGVDTFWGDRFEYSTRARGIEIFNSDAENLIDKEISSPIIEMEDEEYANYDFFTTINLFLDYTEEFLACDKAGTPYKMPLDIYTIIIFIVLLPLVIAYIIAYLIVRFGFVRSMKTAVIKTQAKEFMVKDSLVLTENSDIFSHETETRKYDPPSESEDSGGSSGSKRSGYGGSRGGGGGHF